MNRLSYNLMIDICARSFNISYLYVYFVTLPFSYFLHSILHKRSILAWFTMFEIKQKLENFLKIQEYKKSVNDYDYR